ncbi:hypothetical protein [Bradyrhizobium sp. CW7]|uniref:hypothetical protein n=1 Tax=Bradyrhizobium sp. CW7 TaxID=2782688 RepID=UPI001FFBD736|nr:hypothetical protein [Bradyrhizobium sp. CW7]
MSGGVQDFSILDATEDPVLFTRWFKDRATWQAWFAFMSALFALPMTPEQLAIYEKCTGRTAPPATTAKEAWLVCGRRAGKSFVLAFIAVFLACFKDWQQFLAPGERGTVVVIATDRRQARTIIRYIRALLLQVPLLAQLVERERDEGFDLSCGITIEVGTASFRAVRGYSIVAALLDEIAFLPTDEFAAEPDFEILAALRPGMATLRGSMLLCASSPYARRGALWDAHCRHFSKDGDPVLVWQADTRTMNPTVPQQVIDEAYERDPASANAEYGAEFRVDIEAFISREVVEGCVTDGLLERPPRSGLHYHAFTDPSGGSKDSFTLAIAHREREHAVLDAIREVRPPFSPESVITDFAELCQTYGITRVTGDHYAGEFPREQFRKHGIRYELSAKPKSDLYRDLVPVLNSRRVELLDHPRLVAQLVSLERRTARSGRDSIDHGRGGHDDVANAVAGALLGSTVPQQRIRMGTLQGPYAGGPRGVELDPRTGRPLVTERPRPPRWVIVRESELGAVKGP